MSSINQEVVGSVKQEVAVILMDYTERIPEQVYMDILNRLGQIPDHKDPKKASEIQKELDEVNKKIEILEDENDILREENDDLVQSLADSEQHVNTLAQYFNRIIKNKPTVCNDSVLLFDISENSPEEIESSIAFANRFIDNLDTVRRHHDRTRDILETNDGLGETDDILPSISSLFSTTDEVEIETNYSVYNDSGEVIEKEDETIENSIEIDQDKANSDDNTIDGKDETSMMNTAYHLERNFNYEESIKQYRRITTVFPQNDKAWYRMACLIDKTADNVNDFDTAIGYYYTAMSINSEKNYSRCYNNIGIILEKKGDYDGAEKAYREAIEFDNTHGNRCADTYFNLADLFVGQSKFKEAITELINVLKESPKDIEAREMIEKLLKIKYKSVRRRLVFENIKLDSNMEGSQVIFSRTCSSNYLRFKIISNIPSVACNDCFVKKIINNFNGKINNYYGRMLLHEKNLKNKYVKKGIEKHNEKVVKKMFTRDMKYSVWMKKEQEWNKITKLVNLNLFNYRRIM